MKSLAVILTLGVLFCLPAAPQNPDLHDLFMAGGTMDRLSIHSQALENNFLQENPTRPVSIYLPPGYENTPGNRYPVIYLLHGFSGNHETFFTGKTYGFDLKYMLDTLINRNILSPVIVVCPNAYNRYWGSWYANSFVAGNWEDFITKDLVEYMDSHYRTLASSGGRGITGHSMGGHGSFRLAMKHPGIFAAAYPMSGVLDLEVHLTNNLSEVLGAREVVNFNGASMLKKIFISEAAAFAPDSTKEPFFGQFPMDASGEFIDSIWTRWMEHDPYSLLGACKDSIKTLRALQFDCGISDPGIYDENVHISGAMTDLGIDHVFLEYDGDHGNRIEERMRGHALPFFSLHLDHGVPGILRKSASYLEPSDTLVVEMDQDGVVYLVREHTIASKESINKSQIFSMAVEANSEARFPLSDLEIGHYAVYGINDDQGGISIPLSFVLDSKITPPILSVIADTVAKGDSVYAQSDKDGFIYLAVRGTTPDQIPSRRVKAEAEVTAGIPVGLPTGGLGKGEYLLFAMDQAGLLSQACQVCLAEALGVKVSSASGLKIFPNPTDGHLSVETASSGHYALEIKSLNGQILFVTGFRGNAHQIDLSSLEAGVYLITIRSEDLCITRKIVRY